METGRIIRHFSSTCRIAADRQRALVCKGWVMLMNISSSTAVFIRVVNRLGVQSSFYISSVYKVKTSDKKIDLFFEMNFVSGFENNSAIQGCLGLCRALLCS